MRHALIVGASRGLGQAMSSLLLARDARVFGTSRSGEGLAPGIHALKMDVTDEASIARAMEEVRRVVDRLHLVVHVAGVLHEGEMSPEKKLEDVDPTFMHRAYAVNALGPLLVAKYALPLLRHDTRAVFASLSARVGSIGDNRLGGWYGYRASKAAQNMFIKNLSIELGRRARNTIVVALHPGTVDTDLSKPFQRNVPEGKLFTPQHSAERLLTVIDGLEASDSGGYYDYAAQPIVW